jgi:hypothetical protein
MAGGGGAAGPAPSIPVYTFFSRDTLRTVPVCTSIYWYIPV